jgi:hypothetical protein
MEVVQPRGVRRAPLSQSVRHTFRRDIHAMALTKIAECKPLRYLKPHCAKSSWVGWRRLLLWGLWWRLLQWRLRGSRPLLDHDPPGRPLQQFRQLDDIGCNPPRLSLVMTLAAARWQKAAGLSERSCCKTVMVSDKARPMRIPRSYTVSSIGLALTSLSRSWRFRGQFGAQFHFRQPLRRAPRVERSRGLCPTLSYS